MPKIKLFIFFLSILQLNCVNRAEAEVVTEDGAVAKAELATSSVKIDEPIEVGAARMDTYLPRLRGKRLALVVNPTSRVAGRHLVDTLLAQELDVRKIFALEHGFRGLADAGAIIQDGRDTRTGLPIVSLYGKTKEPSAADLADVDLVIFDVQDVGARFYTYISHLHYILRGAAKHDTPVLILDRPNPNGHYVDGPILEPAFQSFVGMHPVPIVHGLTIGEYGRMTNGEGWLGDGLKAELSVIPCANYRRDMPYELPVPPSPNLPNQRSILLYPSLCFFEGTVISVGRGTNLQFQQFGHPDLDGPSRFTPRPGPGASNPKLNGQVCQGFDLTQFTPEELHARTSLNLDHLILAYTRFKGETFFDRPDFFDKLAGTDRLRQQIESGVPEAEIRAGWAAGLKDFLRRREPYLLY